jgi:hypothetical protein
MKTSNKILLIYFLMALLIMTAVHLTLYAKYKRGEIVPFERIREGRFEEHALPKVKYVSVTGFQRCNILPAAEPKIRIFKMRETRLKYSIVNDTLVITGDSSLAKQDFEQSPRNFQTINLYLPGTEEINAFYTSLFLNGGADSTSAPSWSINLSNGSALTTGDFNNKKAFFNRLQVNANTSNVTFNNESVINELNVHASGSLINNQKADVKHLQLQMDDNSTIMLQGKNLKDINISKQ